MACPDETTSVNDEQRRALSVLARHPNGCAEDLLFGAGFSVGQLTALVMDGLARMEHTVIPGGSRETVTAVMRITEAGRKAIAE